jgi:hypothetical protein
MAYELQWCVEGRVIQAIYSENVTVEDVQQANEQAVQMFQQSGQPPIHLMFDLRPASRVPVNLVKLRQASTIFTQDQMLGWLVAITNNPALTFVASVVPQIMTRKQYHVVPSADAALNFLRKQDPSIDWALADTSLLRD